MRILHEELSWELRRELVENLVEQVRVDTREDGGQRVACIAVIYWFASQRGSARWDSNPKM